MIPIHPIFYLLKGDNTWLRVYGVGFGGSKGSRIRRLFGNLVSEICAASWANCLTFKMTGTRDSPTLAQGQISDLGLKLYVQALGFKSLGYISLNNLQAVERRVSGCRIQWFEGPLAPFPAAVPEYILST